VFFFPCSKLSAVKTYREQPSTSAAGHLGTEGQAENAEVTMPMISRSHFIDAKVKQTYQNPDNITVVQLSVFSTKCENPDENHL